MTFWIIFLVSLLLTNCGLGSAFGWRSGERTRSIQRESVDPYADLSASQLFQAEQNTLNTYETALSELQQLESEPLCHRTAARLLVTNCQLLDGKDEATILTDSGSRVRDFVDAYAASLAICDLERGNFMIPQQCDKFRETALVRIPRQDTSHLHVSSSEIGHCLSGLGTSDSAWNTWVSYRHKALRFCEAARADNEKAEHIRLFQRLTTIMRTMAEGVEEHIDQRMADINNKTQEASDRIIKLSPQLDTLTHGLTNMKDLIHGELGPALKQSADSLNQGTDSITNLRRALEVMVQTVLGANAEAASAYERSLVAFTRKAETEVANFASAMSTAMVLAAEFQKETEQARLNIADLESRQANLEQGMLRLTNITESLSTSYQQHKERLHDAKNATSEILDILEGTTASATTMRELILRRTSPGSWWPYVWCPAASLVMGSYGLAPSATRNLGLVALGEVAAFTISSIASISTAEPAYKNALGNIITWVQTSSTILSTNTAVISEREAGVSSTSAQSH